MLHIGLNIRHLRNLKGLKQQDLADAISYKHNTVSQYETGKNTPSHEDLARIADFFGIPVEMMLRENLKERFATWQEVEEWKIQEQNRKRAAERAEMEVAVAPIKINALAEHYAQYVSSVSGQPIEKIYEEIEAIFARMLEETSGLSFESKGYSST